MSQFIIGLIKIMLDNIYPKHSLIKFKAILIKNKTAHKRRQRHHIKMHRNSKLMQSGPQAILNQFGQRLSALIKAYKNPSKEREQSKRLLQMVTKLAVALLHIKIRVGHSKTLAQHLALPRLPIAAPPDPAQAPPDNPDPDGQTRLNPPLGHHPASRHLPLTQLH
jgi:hypothetical protein